MKRKIAFSALICLFVFASISFAQEDKPLTRKDVAKVVAEAMCIKIEPAIETIPAAQHYETYANALAARGINNFIGKDAAEEFTVGEMKEVYYILTAAGEAQTPEKKAECPVELAPVFALASETKLSQENLDKILHCFPACDLKAEPYTAPVPPAVPGTPETTPEEPSSQIQ